MAEILKLFVIEVVLAICVSRAHAPFQIDFFSRVPILWSADKPFIGAVVYCDSIVQAGGNIQGVNDEIAVDIIGYPRGP